MPYKLQSRTNYRTKPRDKDGAGKKDCRARVLVGTTKAAAHVAPRIVALVIRVALKIAILLLSTTAQNQYLPQHLLQNLHLFQNLHLPLQVITKLKL